MIQLQQKRANCDVKIVLQGNWTSKKLKIVYFQLGIKISFSPIELLTFSVKSLVSINKALQKPLYYIFTFNQSNSDRRYKIYLFIMVACSEKMLYGNKCYANIIGFRATLNIPTYTCCCAVKLFVYEHNSLPDLHNTQCMDRQHNGSTTDLHSVAFPNLRGFA